MSLGSVEFCGGDVPSGLTNLLTVTWYQPSGTPGLVLPSPMSVFNSYLPEASVTPAAPLYCWVVKGRKATMTPGTGLPSNSTTPVTWTVAPTSGGGFTSDPHPDSEKTNRTFPQTATQRINCRITTALPSC